MISSALQEFSSTDLHAALIMDGSGRWATERGLERSAGHRAGVGAVRRVARAAPALGIGTLTLHAFSADNWWRPPQEVAELLRIFHDYFTEETRAWVERGVRVSVLGRRDRLPQDLLGAIEAAEMATCRGGALHLRFCIDYSARDAILQAASRLSGPLEVSEDRFSRLLDEVYHVDAPCPEVDLLIRTGGEQRLSDFLLWEVAYAELVFVSRLWPDFDADDLEAAVMEFQSRERRFGRLPAVAAV